MAVTGKVAHRMPVSRYSEVTRRAFLGGLSLAAIAGTLLIMELTRRVTGMALVTIAALFLVYVLPASSCRAS